jgi:hypothetical protein
MHTWSLALLLPLGSAALPLPLCAQAPPRHSSHLATVRAYGNYAVEGVIVDGNGLAADRVLPAGFTTIAAATDNTAAETVLGWHVEPDGRFAASVSEQTTAWARTGAVDIGTMAAATGRSNEGPHEVRLRIAGTSGLRGKVELWAMGFASAGASTSIEVDVGADGIPDFAYAATATVSFERRQWDVRLPASGVLDVLLTTHGRALVPFDQRGTYFSGLTVRFTPGRFCAIAPYASPCGASLSGYDVVAGGVHALALELADAPASAAGVLVLGAQQVDLPIPGTSCRLHVDPALSLRFTTDSLGAAVHVLPLPAAVARLDLRVQDVVVAPRISSSNGLSVRCIP